MGHFGVLEEDAMKRILLFIIIICVSLTFSSCYEEYPVVRNGIDEFEIGDGGMLYELNDYLIPSETFLKDFSYIDADYHFVERTKYWWLPITYEEKALLEATYEPDAYIQAKEYCLQEMELSDTVIIEYNGYTFIDNNELTLEKNYNNAFPMYFNMLVYNDRLNRLIFMGYYNSDYFGKSEEVTQNWGQFLETNFSDLYDFGSVESSDSSNG